MSSNSVEDPEYRAWKEWLELHRLQSTTEGEGISHELRKCGYGQYGDLQSPASSLQSRDVLSSSAVSWDSMNNGLTTAEPHQSTLVPQSRYGSESLHHTSVPGDTNVDGSVAPAKRPRVTTPQAGGRRRMLRGSHTDTGENNRSRQLYAPYPKGRGGYSRRVAEQRPIGVSTQTAESPRRTSWDQQWWHIEEIAARSEAQPDRLELDTDDPDPSLDAWVGDFLKFV